MKPHVRDGGDGRESDYDCVPLIKPTNKTNI
jgi:hypothetical protein